jgi:hypothetical protein
MYQISSREKCDRLGFSRQYGRVAGAKRQMVIAMADDTSMFHAIRIFGSKSGIYLHCAFVCALGMRVPMR